MRAGSPATCRPHRTSHTPSFRPSFPACVPDVLTGQGCGRATTLPSLTPPPSLGRGCWVTGLGQRPAWRTRSTRGRRGPCFRADRLPAPCPAGSRSPTCGGTAGAGGAGRRRPPCPDAKRTGGSQARGPHGRYLPLGSEGQPKVSRTPEPEEGPGTPPPSPSLVPAPGDGPTGPPAGRRAGRVPRGSLQPALTCLSRVLTLFPAAHVTLVLSVW